MERDPVRFVWRTAPGLHVLFVLLLLVAAVPAAGFAIELVRLALDDAVGGRAFAKGAEQPFLRLVLELPSGSAPTTWSSSPASRWPGGTLLWPVSAGLWPSPPSRARSRSSPAASRLPLRLAPSGRFAARFSTPS
jgi:hypothetical protein